MSKDPDAVGNDEARKTERFVQLIAEHQNRLHGYVYSLLGDTHRANDVVQETNLVLWRKLDEFDTDRPFLPWALGIARFQVLAHIRDRGRDRCLLDPDLAESLSVAAEGKADLIEEYRDSLRHCIDELTPNNQDLIRFRYDLELPIAEVATRLGRTVGACKVALLRVRRQLAQCVGESHQTT